MSDLGPKGPAQPTLNQSYETSGNPASQTSEEKASGATNANTNASTKIAQRDSGDVPSPQRTTPARKKTHWAEASAMLAVTSPRATRE